MLNLHRDDADRIAGQIEDLGIHIEELEDLVGDLEEQLADARRGERDALAENGDLLDKIFELEGQLKAVPS